MARYKAVLAYDGALFNGFQRQRNVRTVQSEIEKALRKIGWQGSSILAAGRTDTGVHAAGQMIAFDLDWKHSISDLQNAINANLPEDTAVREVDLTTLNFHPRYDATSRHYRYHLFHQPVRDPLRERYAWRVWPPVALERVRTATNYLLGSHDFAAFGSPPKPAGSTVRMILEAGWSETEDQLSFDLIGNAFLYHMVRRIVNLLVEIGQYKAEPEIIKIYLAEASARTVQGLAPPQGLVLMAVHYPAASA